MYDLSLGRVNIDVYVLGIDFKARKFVKVLNTVSLGVTHLR